MKALSFFPWLNIPAPIEVGAYLLTPHELTNESNSSANIESESIKRILKPYRDKSKRSVRKITLLIKRGGPTIREIDDDEREELFLITELIAFCGLARRKFFTSF